MAGQALGILDVHGRAPALGEPDQRGLVEGVPGVIRARSVAGFAALPLTVGLRIQPEDLRMQRLAEVLVLLAVAFDAARLADVLARLRGRLAREVARRAARGAARQPSRPWPGPSRPSGSRCRSRSFACATREASVRSSASVALFGSTVGSTRRTVRLSPKGITRRASSQTESTACSARSGPVAPEARNRAIIAFLIGEGGDSVPTEPELRFTFSVSLFELRKTAVRQLEPARQFHVVSD